MMRAEKFAVFMIIDKKSDMDTYLSMGASPALIEKIFILQGWLISLIGAAIGIVIGLILCIIQQTTGLISLPGNYIVNAYPVEIHLADIIITFGGVALIGYLIALLPVKIMK